MRVCTVPLLSLLGLIAAACAVDDGSRLSGPPLQFDDVPVPDGMKLQTELNESHSRETGAERIGHFVYYGNLKVAEIRDYMTSRMPLHGWSLVDETAGENLVVLTFDKHPDQAVCRIRKDEGSVVRMIVDVVTKLP